MRRQARSGAEEAGPVLVDSALLRRARLADEEVKGWLRAALLELFATGPDNEDSVERKAEQHDDEGDAEDAHGAASESTPFVDEKGWQLYAESLGQVDACEDQVERHREHQPVQVNAQVRLHMVPHTRQARGDEGNTCQRPSTVEGLSVQGDVGTERWLLQDNVEQASVDVEEAAQSMEHEDDLDAKVQVRSTTTPIQGLDEASAGLFSLGRHCC